MVKRYRGGLISATDYNENGLMAGSIFTLSDRAQISAANTAGWISPLDFLISPAINGKTEWNLQEDGNLILSSPDVYTITALKNFSKVVKMWGGSGKSDTAGSTDWGRGAGGGAATGVVSFISGATYIFRVGSGGATGTAPPTAYGAGNGGGTYSVGVAGSGGGYSGIFLSSVTQANAILMAGGGGGGASDRGDGLGGRGGDAGGGATAQSSGDLTGGAGSQVAGGGGYGAGGSGTALQGGHGTGGGGGGGGGYYGGGGGGNHPDGGAGGGGGSGYFNSTYVTSQTLYTGSGVTVGNNSDPDKPTNAGAGGTTNTSSNPGAIIIKA